MSAVPVQKPRYRTLKVPDPAHLVMRLKQGVKAGVLSRVPRTAYVGQEFLLVNERLKEGETTRAWARVRLGPGAAFRDGPTAVKTLGAKLDGLTAREFSEVDEQVWFHPLALLEAYKEPKDVTGVTPGGRRYTGEGTIQKTLTEKQKADLTRENALIRENQKKPEARKRHRFEAAKWTHPNGHPRCLICGGEERMSGWCHSLKADAAANRAVDRGELSIDNAGRHAADRYAAVKRDDADPQELKGMETAALLSLLQALEREFERRGHDASKSEDLINSARFILDELKRRGATVPSGRLVDQAREIVEKGLFGYPAGKSAMAKLLVSMMPEHDCYVEPFVGSGAVLLAKEPAKVEVVNDANPEIAAVWKTLCGMSDADLKQLMAKDWVGRAATYQKVRASSGGDAVQSLYRFLYLSRFSLNQSRGKAFRNDSEGTRATTPSRLAKLVPRLRRVKVRAGDYEAACRKHDSPSTLFFFDPPYRGHDAGVGERAFDERRFFQFLRSLKGKWIVTYGGRGELPSMLRSAGYPIRQHATHNSFANTRPGARTAKLVNIIAYNYKLPSGVSKAFAPVAQSGEKKGRVINLHEVVDAIGDAMIRRAAVSVVGGLVNHGKTEGDVDILIKGPLDEATKRVIEFRVGRMLAARDPEIADRVQFLHEDLGGPFTDHVELFDLTLVARPAGQRKVINMSAEMEKADPITELAEKPGPKRAVLQAHFRGKSLHLDLRLQQDGHLIGFTLAAQKAGAIPDVNTVEQARQIVSGFDVKGSASFKPLLAPAKVQAFPKTRQPVEWLEAKDQVIKPGEVGATAEEEGVLVVVDRPYWEEGRVEPYFREIFLTRGKHLNGVLFARKLVGRGGAEGQQTPEGEVFWNVWLSKEALPSILSTRAVRRGDMPPDGRSWIPTTLEQATPREYRYWEHKGAEAKRIRDELVNARYFTDANVKVVDGQFRRVVTKHFLTEQPEQVRKADGHAPPAGARAEAKLGLQWRREYGRGGTAIGVARARDISNGRELSLETLGRMRSYFARHEVDRKAEGWNPGEKGYPSAGRVAWSLWGGDPARRWVERILSRAETAKAADVRQFVLARQAYKGQQVIREGPTKTRWFLMFPAGGGPMHMLQMDADPTEEKASVAGVHVHVRGTDLMELDGPADPGMTVDGYKVNPTKNTPSDWRIVDSGKVAVLEEEPNRWVLNFSGQDLKGRWLAEAEEPGSKLWTLQRYWDGRSELGGNVKKALLQRDGITVWDPKRKDPDVDRTELKPPAIFAPQKPSEQNEFHKPEEVLSEFATSENLETGIAVEPKLNGRVVVCERDAEGRVVIFFEDTLRDRSKWFPGLTAATKALGRPAILVGEMVDYLEGAPLPRRELAVYGQDKVHDDSNVKVHVWDVLYWGGKNVTDRPWDERLPFRRRAFRSIKGDTFVDVPSKVAHTEAELREAMQWAGRQDASEGAMLKSANGTYSLGGQTSSDAKLKLVREIKAIVISRETKTPAPTQRAPARTYVYTCGVGPIKDPEQWEHTSEVGGKHYVTIGKTFASNISAQPGEVLRVEVTELLLDKQEPHSLTWFTPMVVEKVGGQPMTPAAVSSLVREDEIKKSIVIKSEAERYVFGLVLEPNDGKGRNPFAPDTQKDTYSAEEIRSAWWRYTIESGKHGLLHRQFLGNNKIVMLDNYIAPDDMKVGDQIFRKGSWVMGAYIKDDALWERVQDGTYTGWSVDGSAIRQLMRRAA